MGYEVENDLLEQYFDGNAVRWIDPHLGWQTPADKGKSERVLKTY